MRWHSRLSSLQNAANSITLGALDIQRATGLRKMPDLTEKNAINTFLLFSPSLSPDLFIFLELCLHCLAFTGGDVGCCSARINGTLMYLSNSESTCSSNLSCYFSQKASVDIFSVKRHFVEKFLKDTLKAQREKLQVPMRPCARGGSSFSTL